MIHADADLARRLEGIICVEWRRLADTTREWWPEKGATYLDVAGGVALWLGDGSPVNVAVGLGMEAPVDEAGLRQVEDFYASRGGPPILATCPFADPSLFALLAKRGWQITEFENVLALELGGPAASAAGAAGAASAAGAEGAAEGAGAAGAAGGAGAAHVRGVDVCGVDVRVASTPEERALWGRIAARGFSDEGEPGSAQEDFGSLMAARRDAILVLAWADGEPVGTGALGIDGTVGWLSGDSTLPQYRRRGIQQAIQRHRLKLAQEAGCTLAVTESAPGSGSQRNMERLGFRVVYTHLEFTRV
jgi:GNAT superfamily N-acetyltransferase